MRTPILYGAAYNIVKNPKWEILMIKRKNTGYKDGYYGLPAGHIEWIERPSDAAERELLEEVWLRVKKEDLKIIHISHRLSPQENWSIMRTYMDFYFEVLSYTGIPENKEEESSEWIFWIDWKKEEKIQFREILERIEKGERYSETII